MANFKPPWNKGKKQSPEERKAKRQAYYQKNRDHILARVKKYSTIRPQRTAEYQRWGNIKNKYGITRMEWEAMFAAQGHKCAICPFAGDMKKFHTDHCHATGKVRGILCNGCNTAIGLIKESFDTALGVAKYIQKHKDVV